MNKLRQQIFSINTEEDFNQSALAVFQYQSRHCAIYKSFIDNLNINPDRINFVREIPFLPINFFKTHQVISGTEVPEQVFSSSGTTTQTQSLHYVTGLNWYEQSFNTAFKLFYGSPKDTCILALLPSYMERDGSSLIYMVDALLRQSQHPNSGYFLHNHVELKNLLEDLKQKKQNTILLGVTYALLDFIEKHPINYPDLIVMETGGMKGKRKEMVREELHEMLKNGFGVKAIHSEYGMTELLSQAYSYGDGIFTCPSWMKILLRDTNDPLSLVCNNQTGGINVVDLANVNSCSFIATQDLGRLLVNGKFKVLGRFDNADIRGCNLLVS